jgi:ferredoxin--NADP+ reductase
MIDAAKHLEDEFDPSVHYGATVVSSERISPAGADAEVRELVLEVDRTDLPCEVGQSVGVLAPGDRTMGQRFHYRLYSVADLPEAGPTGRPRIKICVRRCSWVDEYSGERRPGVASNYLCDLAPGDRVELTGPFGLAFDVPEDPTTDLLLIGSGTGIAPFRALVKHLYREVPDWRGRVLLFHGARSGLELLYMNDLRDDFAQYYDMETFEAFKALSPRPSWADPIAWDLAIEARGEELWDLLGKPKTYVYLAGLEKMRDELDKVFARLAGSPEKWRRRKAELEAGGRWVELLY